MSSAATPTIEELLARYIEQLDRTGDRLDIAALCGGDAERIAALDRLIAGYEAVESLLGAAEAVAPADAADASLPSVPGFRTIERLGRGGSGRGQLGCGDQAVAP